MNRRTILFFPERPADEAVITAICHATSWTIAVDPASPCDLAIAWDTNTFRDPIPALERLSTRVAVWNLGCVDISKRRVEAVFRDTFGYPSLLDPLVHRGSSVSKSNLNGAHDGLVIECPLTAPDPDRVYQRLIHNESSDGVAEDLRTPILRSDIPFVYRKYRPVESRFGQIDTLVTIEEAAAVYTADERASLAQFARALGMDYGELDVLRDREDGRLYVVDANPTPFGPPPSLPPSGRQLAIDRLAAACERAVGARKASIAFSQRAAVAMSVIVVARNEGRRLRDTVAQLCDTLRPPNEIIVVDDGSEDGSADAVIAELPRVQMVRGGGLGVARARNLGGSTATGRILVFADAHLTIPDEWCGHLESALADPSVGGAAPAITNSECPWLRGYGLRFTGFELDVDWLPRLGDESYAVPLMPWCFGAMRRDVFESTGGFDSGMIQWGSIDNEMSVRLWSLGYELKIVPELEVGHFFRDERPYPIEWMPVLHNRLRLAFVHFDTDQVAGVVHALAADPAFPGALARVIDGDVSTRRRAMASRRVRDTEWLFRDCAQT
jgi:GT2 family glycosyltransferase